MLPSKLGTVYWRDYTEYTADTWDQESERVEFIPTRDEFWEDPYYYSAAVDYDNTCHAEESRQRENRKKKGIKMLAIVQRQSIQVKANGLWTN
jgi:hypothetical protein